MSKNFRKGFRELFCRTERRIIIGGEPYQPKTDTVGNSSHLKEIGILFFELMLPFHLYKNKLRSNRCQQIPAKSDAYSDSLPLPKMSKLYVQHR